MVAMAKRQSGDFEVNLTQS